MSADNRETQQQTKKDADEMEPHKAFVFDFDGTITVLEGELAYQTYNYHWQLMRVLGENSAAYKYLISEQCQLKDLQPETIKNLQDDDFTSEIQQELQNKLFLLAPRYMYTSIGDLKKISKGFEPALNKLLGKNSPAYKYIFSGQCKLDALYFDRFYFEEIDDDYTQDIKHEILDKLGCISCDFTKYSPKYLFNMKKENLEILQKLLGDSSVSYQYLSSDYCKLGDLRLSTINAAAVDDKFTEEVKKELLNKLVRQEVVEWIKREKKAARYIVSFSDLQTLLASLKILGLEIGDDNDIQAISCKGCDLAFMHGKNFMSLSDNGSKQKTNGRIEQIEKVLARHESRFFPGVSITGDFITKLAERVASVNKMFKLGKVVYVDDSKTNRSDLVKHKQNVNRSKQSRIQKYSNIDIVEVVANVNDDDVLEKLNNAADKNLCPSASESDEKRDSNTSFERSPKTTQSFFKERTSTAQDINKTTEAHHTDFNNS